jgi:hypothetical protein
VHECVAHRLICSPVSVCEKRVFVCVYERERVCVCVRERERERRIVHDLLS